MTDRRIAIRSLVSAVLVAAGSTLPARALAQGTDDPVSRCDTLAANPLDKSDPERPGIAYNKIDAPAAVEACTAASAARPDDARLRHQLGRALDKAERYKEALAAHEAAEKGGYLFARLDIGYEYVYGGEGFDKDYAKAARYFKRCLGEVWGAECAAELGWLAENGWGVPKDDAEAARLYRIGADAGLDFAQNNLGTFMSGGRGGLKVDKAEAARLFKLAADQGHQLAAVNLGELYEAGTGVPRDLGKAEALFRSAVVGIDAAAAAKARNDLAWLLATQDRSLDEAETLVREALKTNPDTAAYEDTLAWVLHGLRRDDEALAAQLKVVAAEPGNPRFRARLGDIYESLGKPEDAKAAWREAIGMSWADDGEVGGFGRETYENKLAR